MPYNAEGYELHEFARGRTDDDRKAPPQFSPHYRGGQANPHSEIRIPQSEVFIGQPREGGGRHTQ